MNMSYIGLSMAHTQCTETGNQDDQEHARYRRIHAAESPVHASNQTLTFSLRILILL